MKTELKLFGITAILMLALTAYAAVEGASVYPGTPETATPEAGGQVLAFGGNITELNLSGSTQTCRWQGYWGEVNGSITLDDASGNTMYDWEWDEVNGTVYASTAASPTWTAVDTNDRTPTALDTALSYTSGSDQAVDTYTDNTNPELIVGTVTVSANSRAAVTLNSGNFQNILLYDGANDIFAAPINADAADFKSGTSDYELMVPEDNCGNSDATTYYFFLELK